MQDLQQTIYECFLTEKKSGKPKYLRHSNSRSSHQITVRRTTRFAARKAKTKIKNLFPFLLRLLFHHRAGRHFLRTLAVPAGFLRRFFDVLVLALFFRTRPTEMFFSWHNSKKKLRVSIFGSIEAVMLRSPRPLRRTAPARRSRARRAPTSQTFALCWTRNSLRSF